jgi:hypothetical protein
MKKLIKSIWLPVLVGLMALAWTTSSAKTKKVVDERALATTLFVAR